MSSRSEELLTTILEGATTDIDPQCRKETFLKAIANGDASNLPEPTCREEVLLKQIAENGTGGSGEIVTEIPIELIAGYWATSEMIDNYYQTIVIRNDYTMTYTPTDLPLRDTFTFTIDGMKIVSDNYTFNYDPKTTLITITDGDRSIVFKKYSVPQNSVFHGIWIEPMSGLFQLVLNPDGSVEYTQGTSVMVGTYAIEDNVIELDLGDNGGLKLIYIPFKDKLVWPGVIMEDGSTGVEYQRVVPSGELEITTSGKFDVLKTKSVNVNVGGGTDRLQWKCDNMQSLNSEFQDYEGTDLGEVLNGLDTSKVRTMNRAFAGCTYMTNFPALNTENVEDMQYIHSSNKNLENIPNYDYTNVKNMALAFQYCSNKLLTASLVLPNCTGVNSMFSYCSKLEEVNLNIPLGEYLNGICTTCSNLKTAIMNSKPLSLDNAFFACRKLETVKGIDMIKTSNTNQAFSMCERLTNLELKNIKKDLQIGSGELWGHLLTLESLLNALKEYHINTGTSTITLTMGTANTAKLANVYVKLIDITDEMRAEDEYIDNKLPFEVCESTDEGAMLLLEDYTVTLKNIIVK